MRSAMIYGPTQMGKTAASHIFVRKCMDTAVPVIISTDNRTDQLDQFHSRFREAFGCETTTTILKVSDRRFLLTLQYQGRLLLPSSP